MARLAGESALTRGGHLHFEQFQELLGIWILCLVRIHGFVFHKMMGIGSKRLAYLAPFLVFLAFLLLAEAVAKIGEGYAWWALSQPRYWVFPVQTLVCAALLWKIRTRVELRPLNGFGFATLIGLLAF